jgi:hypothetical protein
MKLIVEYIAESVKFERMAAEQQDAAVKAQMEDQAAAYRKLAGERAKKLGIPPPERPEV